MEPSQTPATKSNRVSLSLDLRLLVLLLVATIVVMLLIWKPWEDRVPANAQTVVVTGESTVKAEPDEFVFYPTYQTKATDKDAALAEITAKSDEIVTKLKALGVADKNIKTDTSGYEKYRYMSPDVISNGTTTYSFNLTVTVDDKDLAQNVQDYLVTTAPTGSVSPQPAFSDAKRKELESDARDEATKDARAKADQSAKNLGFSVSRVKSVVDSNGFGTIMPYGLDDGTVTTDAVRENSKSLAVQPGENELNYSVTVTYYIK